MSWIEIAVFVSSPSLAVAIGWLLNIRQAKRERRAHILRVLMSSVGAEYRFEYVAALNLLPMEYSDSAEVQSAYRKFVGHLNEYNQSEEWGRTLIDLRVNLIERVARRNGFKWSSLEIKEAAYAPKIWHDQLHIHQLALEALPRIAASSERAVGLQQDLLSKIGHGGSAEQGDSPNPARPDGLSPPGGR